MGRGSKSTLEYSPETAAEIDKEMKYLMDKAHTDAYNILAEYRDYLDKLAEKLLEKETLRRPDLEALFDGITPRQVGQVFPEQDARFPRQEGREPVKTPTELAIERGEEPPKPFSLLDASKAARAKRQAELAQQAAVAQDAHNNQVEQPQNKAETTPETKETPVLAGGLPQQEASTSVFPAQPKKKSSRYAGSQPPAGWTVPGDRDAKPSEADTSEIQAQTSVSPAEEVGFRLPERERTENEWKDSDEHPKATSSKETPS